MVQRVRRAVAPHGDARSHFELVTMIARKAGWVEGEKWQTSARQAFLHMVGALAADVSLAADPATAKAAGFAQADWGRELLPIQLRFANSRG
jgi:hypothetical protein